MFTRQILAGAFLALVASTGSARATPAPLQDGWLAFQGCWRAQEAAASELLCIVSQADGNGVRIIELADGRVVREAVMVADGGARAVTQEGCSGEESARWSADGRRVYLQTHMNCGASIDRNSTGLFAFVSASEWLSINAIAVDQEAAIRTVRYQLVEGPANLPESIASALRANRMARETARLTVNAALTEAELLEAIKHVHPRAVEALLFERKQSFALNGKQLLALADAGTPQYVIDAIVAVSNPERFAVRTAEPADEADERSRRRGYGYCDDMSWYDRYCSRYGYGYDYLGYGYSPFGYYSPWGYRTPRVVIITNPDPDAEVPRHGRVTRRGYTNGRSDSGASVSGASRSSSSGSSASSKSGSSSSGSSSSSSSRGQAKPRGG